MLLAACSRFCIAPAEMLYVGDSAVDIAAARAAGCPVIAVSYGYGRDHDDLHGAAAHIPPDARVDKLTDLVTICLRPSTDQPLRLCTTGANS
jgi:phosphoglycolate phosphatase